MRTTTEGIALIQEFEGCSLASYQDQGGIWTIGWGCTRGVAAHQTITQDEANERFLTDLRFTEQALLDCLPSECADKLSDSAFSALVSFCYNVGFGKKGHRAGFRELYDGRPSTMLRMILAGDLDRAAIEFPKWNQVAGKESAGILRRRLAEQALFLK